MRTPLAQPLGSCRHLVRVVTDLAQAVAPLEFEIVPSTSNSKSIGLSEVGTKIRARPSAPSWLPIPRTNRDGGRITLDRGIDTSPHRHRGVGSDGAAVVHASHQSISMKLSSEATNGFRSSSGTDADAASAHLLDPLVRLPRRLRLVRPEHQHAVASMQIRTDFWLGETATVQVLQQLAFAFEPCISNDQAFGGMVLSRNYKYEL